MLPKLVLLHRDVHLEVLDVRLPHQRSPGHRGPVHSIPLRQAQDPQLLLALTLGALHTFASATEAIFRSQRHYPLYATPTQPTQVLRRREPRLHPLKRPSNILFHRFHLTYTLLVQTINRTRSHIHVIRLLLPYRRQMGRREGTVHTKTQA